MPANSMKLRPTDWDMWAWGATTIGPHATHPPAICQNLRGWGWGLGEQLGGVFAAWPGWGVPQGVRDPLLPHAYLKGGYVCVGAWGYRGMCAILALSRLCREEKGQNT